MFSTKKKHKCSGNSYLDWLERYQDELQEHNVVSLQSVYPYIEFKLSYDFAFASGNSIDIDDPVAIDYFLGKFDYKQVVKDFKRSAIVLQTQIDRLYFGSPFVSQKRMRSMSLHMQKPVEDFSTFITSLEEKVLKCGFMKLNKAKKRTLGMILRIINQGVSAVALKMLDAHLKVRSSNTNGVSFRGNDIGWLMQPDVNIEKGSTQIDIICGDSKIQLSRREYFLVQKLDREPSLNMDDERVERWSILMLFSRIGPEESSQWKLQFSASKVDRYTDGLGLLSVRSLSKSTKSELSRGGWTNDRLGVSNRSTVSTVSRERSCSNRRSTSVRNFLKSVGIHRGSKHIVRQDVSWIGKRRSDSERKRVCSNSQTQNSNLVDYLRQYEVDMKMSSTIPLKEIHPYIDFKLVHSQNVSEDSCINIKDWLAIDYFLGEFSMTKTMKNFTQSTIVLHTQTELLYFGCPTPPNGSVRQVNDFYAFINSLEQEVFKYKFGEREKRTLGVILRLLCQSENSVAVKMLNGLLQSRVPERGIIRPVFKPKGSVRIDIVHGQDSINMSRQENFMMWKKDSNMYSQQGTCNGKTWRMQTNIDQINLPGLSDWNLHFSVVPSESEVDAQRIARAHVTPFGRLSRNNSDIRDDEELILLKSKLEVPPKNHISPNSILDYSLFRTRRPDGRVEGKFDKGVSKAYFKEYGGISQHMSTAWLGSHKFCV